MIFCWRESGWLRLTGESRFLMKKGYRQASFLIETVCKVNTDSNTSSSNYWSSTENGNNNAFDVNFNNGNVNNNKGAVLFSFLSVS